MHRSVLPPKTIPSFWKRADYKSQIVPTYRGNPLIEALPRIPSNEEEVLQSLQRYPEFEIAHRNEHRTVRRHLVMQLLDFVQPLSWHLELSLNIGQLLMSGYISRNPIARYFERDVMDIGHRMAQSMIPQPAMGSACSMSVLGQSGIGKSTAIGRILSTYPRVILHTEYKEERFICAQIPWIKLDCPFDCSVKGLCYTFFKQVDELLNTDYYERYSRARLSTDLAIVAMSKVVALHGIGILVVDEIQNLQYANGGNDKLMLNFLVQLANVLQIPIVVIGTWEARYAIAGDFRQSRRNSGLGSMVLKRMQNDDEFYFVCQSLWKYVYVRNAEPLTRELASTLFDLCQGIIDILVKLFILTQIRSMACELETLTGDLFKSVFLDCFKLLAPHLIGLRNNNPQSEARINELLRRWDIEEAKLIAEKVEGGAVTVSSSAPAVPTGTKKNDNVGSEVAIAHEVAAASTPKQRRRGRETACEESDGILQCFKRAKDEEKQVYVVYKESGYIVDAVGASLES